jgi:hypothetical protein
MAPRWSGFLATPTITLSASSLNAPFFDGDGANGSNSEGRVRDMDMALHTDVARRLFHPLVLHCEMSCTVFKGADIVIPAAFAGST